MMTCKLYSICICTYMYLHVQSRLSVCKVCGAHDDTKYIPLAMFSTSVRA